MPTGNPRYEAPRLEFLRHRHPAGWGPRLLIARMDRLQPEFRNRLIRSCAETGRLSPRSPRMGLRGNHILRDAVGLAWAARFLTGPLSTDWMNTATHIASRKPASKSSPTEATSSAVPCTTSMSWRILSSLGTPRITPRLRPHAPNCPPHDRLRPLDPAPRRRNPQFNDAAQHAVASPNGCSNSAENSNNSISKPTSPSAASTSPIPASSPGHAPSWTLFFDIGQSAPTISPATPTRTPSPSNSPFQGERLIVDPGAFSYDRDARREYDRSTAAHNTVCIDRENSTEVWDIFRVGRRALPASSRSQHKQRVSKPLPDTMASTTSPVSPPTSVAFTRTLSP